MKTETVILPEGCELHNYDDDLVLVCVGMTAERFQEIKASLPTDVRQKLIGWRSVVR